MDIVMQIYTQMGKYKTKTSEKLTQTGSLY